MKIAYCSDLHLEFGEEILKNTENADVLVLAGDIIVVDLLDNPNWQYKIYSFFNNISKEFYKIIVLCGNHEYYNGDIKTSFWKYAAYLSQWGNIYFLDDAHIEIDNVRFIGSTLWSDLGGIEDHTIWAQIRFGMNDYRLIKNGDSTLSPEDTIEFFKKSKKYIENNLSGSKTNVVVTHHAPSKSSGTKYDPADVINLAYYSILDGFIEKSNIKAWIHGHTHNPADYMIGDTRILSNPKGYHGHELISFNFTLKYLEV